MPVVKCDVIPICPYIKLYCKLHELWMFLKYDLSPSLAEPRYLRTDINKIISASLIRITQGPPQSGILSENDVIRNCYFFSDPKAWDWNLTLFSPTNMVFRLYVCRTLEISFGRICFKTSCVLFFYVLSINRIIFPSFIIHCILTLQLHLITRIKIYFFQLYFILRYC